MAIFHLVATRKEGQACACHLGHTQEKEASYKLPECLSWASSILPRDRKPLFQALLSDSLRRHDFFFTFFFFFDETPLEAWVLSSKQHLWGCSVSHAETWNSSTHAETWNSLDKELHREFPGPRQGSLGPTSYPSPHRPKAMGRGWCKTVLQQPSLSLRIMLLADKYREQYIRI